MTSAPLVLGVDLGTGSSKGVVAELDGTVVARARRTATQSSPAPDRFEMNPETQWWQVFTSLSSELVDACRGREISAVCISGLGPSVVVGDAENRPLRPGILYGIDTRARAQIASFNERLGAKQILARAGKDLSAQAGAPKLAWIRDNEPDVWARMVRWYSAHGFVVARLTGEWVIDHHTASQFDPLYDVVAQAWATDWVDELFGDLPLPRLVWPQELVGTVSLSVAAETGLRQGTPVAAGTIDAWAEAYSAGVRRPGDLMIMYGSTMFLVQVIPAPAISAGLWTTSAIEPHTHTIAAGMSTSGSLITWTQDIAGGVSFEEMIADARRSPPGSNGLLVLPYFAGERSPIHDPDARGTITGLTLAHRRADLFRAVHEASAFGLRQILESLEKVVGSPARIVAVGGGTADGFWPQIVSDVIKRSQELPSVTIGACYGDALMAAIASGLVPGSTTWAATDSTITPDPTSARVYDEMFQIYKSAYPAMRSSMHRLADTQRTTWTT